MNGLNFVHSHEFVNLSMRFYHWFAQIIVGNLDISKRDTLLPAGSQRFHHRFFRCEPGGVALVFRFPGFTLPNLVIGKNLLAKAFQLADASKDSLHFDVVDTYSKDQLALFSIEHPKIKRTPSV